MATSAVMNHGVVTTITGNELTITGETFGSTGLGTLTLADISAKKMGLRVVGDIHGYLWFPFADPDTLEGALQPADLKTAIPDGYVKAAAVGLLVLGLVGRLFKQGPKE